MISQLFLDFPNIKNTKVLRISDSSQYNESIDVTCGQLLITPPGFSYPAGFNVDPYFSVVFNTASLGLSGTCPTCELSDLPDGIYIVYYSISPNEILNVEYNHMRIALLEKTYAELLCSLYAREGTFKTEEFEQQLKTLKKIKRQMDACVILVEEKHLNEKGIELYQKVEKDLNKYKGQLNKCKNC